ncbi:hypothetical protein D1872_267190 [compost metagenome]
MRCGALEQVLDLLFRQLDRQNAVFETVIVENVRKRWCNDAAESIIHDRPWCMLTRRSAAEVGARNEDGCPFITGFVQFKRRIVVSLFVKAPFVEQKLSKSGALDPFQKLFRNDCVRIHVYAVNRCHDALQCFECFHIFRSPFVPCS